MENKSQLIVKKSPIHGRGVFANCNISKGTEFSYNILKVWLKELPESLSVYTFPFEDHKIHCICMGDVSFLNHSKTPNFKIKRLDRQKKIKTFCTLEYIPEGKEILINYGYDL